MSTLAGIGAGSLGRLLIGAIAGSGIPEYEASLVSLDKKKKGGFMLGVYCHPRRAAEARKLLDVAGATHIREKGVPTQAMRYRTAREYSGVES